MCIHPTWMHINQAVHNTGIQLLSKQWTNSSGPLPEEVFSVIESLSCKPSHLLPKRRLTLLLVLPVSYLLPKMTV